MFPRGQKYPSHPTPWCLAHSRCSGAKGQGGVHFLRWNPLQAREVTPLSPDTPCPVLCQPQLGRTEWAGKNGIFPFTGALLFLACLLCSSFPPSPQLIISPWCWLLRRRPRPPRRPAGEGQPVLRARGCLTWPGGNPQRREGGCLLRALAFNPAGLPVH